MSRQLRLILTVDETEVGSILADLEGRHRGVAFEVVDAVDGRSKVAKTLKPPRDGADTIPVLRAKAVGSATERLREKILAFLKGTTLTKTQLVKLTKQPPNRVGYQLVAMHRLHLITLGSNKTWSLGKKNGGAPLPKAPKPKKLRTTRGAAGGEKLRTDILDLLKNMGPQRAKDIARAVGATHDAVGWQGVILGKEKKIVKSQGLWSIANGNDDHHVQDVQLHEQGPSD